MRASLKKTVAGSLAALVLAVGVTAAASPASADPYWGWRYHHHGYWGGPALGLGIAGLAAGAIIASQGPYYGGYGYDDCTHWVPTRDAWGRYVGRRPVNVCY
jgi:hypothetical protein